MSTGADAKSIPNARIKERMQQKLADENLLSLRKRFAFFDVLAEDAQEAIYDGEANAEMWRMGKKAFDDCTAALLAGDSDQLRISHQILGGIFKNGLRSVVAKEELHRITELQVRVQGGEIKRFQAMDIMIDPVAFDDFVTLMQFGIRSYVSDAAAAKAFAGLIERAIAGKTETRSLGPG